MLRIIFILLTFTYINITEIHCQSFGKNAFFLQRSATNITELTPNSSSSNPIRITNSDSNKLNLFVSPNKFGLSELNSGILDYIHPIDSNFFAGASLFGLGNELYSEFAFSLSMAYKQAENFSLAMEANYNALNIQDSQLEQVISLNIGGTVFLSDLLTAGIFLENVNNAYFEGGENTSFRRAVVGLGGRFSENFTAELSAIVNINRSSGFGASFSYAIMEDINFAAGIQSLPRLLYFQIFIEDITFFDFSISSEYHDLLGFSNVVGISFQF